MDLRRCYDALISGGLSKGDVYADEPADTPAMVRALGIEAEYYGFHPIAGGSDAPE